jgi:phosphotriesterase-related protein
VAATGFHLRKHYGSEDWIYNLEEEGLLRVFCDELMVGVYDEELGITIRTGIIKTAYAGDVGDVTFRRLFGAACAASNLTGAPLMIHTERGEGVEDLVGLLSLEAIDPSRVIIAHMDKRPDAALHGDLIREGFLLEFDTFLRPKYEPERNVWPLVEQLLADRHEGGIACGLDLADRAMWRYGGGAHGQEGLMTVVQRRLELMGVPSDACQALLRENILRRICRRLDVEKPDLAR